MSDQEAKEKQTIVVHSSRFGDISVPADSIIEIPNGLIGFPRHHKFVMIEHKPPFSWLHSVEDADLAFVVVDGFQFGESYNVKPPFGEKDCDIKEGDEYAILVLITVRSDPRLTTANLKAPLFVSIKNRRGVQVIFDDPRYSTRFPLWSEEEIAGSEKAADETVPGDTKKDSEKK